MTRLCTLGIAIAFFFAACNASNENVSASPSSSTTATASSRASVTAAPSARSSAKQIDLQVVVPDDGNRAGVNGIGWTVDVVAKGTGPAMDKIKPGIRGGGTAGMHPNFPGLVVLLKSSAPTQSLSAKTNLAGLFQIIGLPHTLGPVAGISSVGTSAPASPASTGASGAVGPSGASATMAGTAASRTLSSIDEETAEATWFVDQPLWGTDVDIELTAFVVDGDAPGTVSDRSSLKIVSNEVTVRFHLNAAANVPFGPGKPSAAPSSSP